MYYTYGELYDRLYDMSVELDEQRLSESAAGAAHSAVPGKGRRSYAEYIAGLAEADPADKTLTGLKNAYAAVTGALSDIQSAEDVRPSARVKYAIADILVTMLRPCPAISEEENFVRNRRKNFAIAQNA